MRNSFIFILLALSATVHAQPERIKSIFPEGVSFRKNIPYANDTLKKHQLDIYLPPNAKANTPLVIWIHGGAWNHGDKYSDMGYMKATISSIIENGYALASIDYRQSSTAIFPAQIRDCYQAIEYLSVHAAEYQVDKGRFVLFGFSAGGHLASLLGLSLNNNVATFHPTRSNPTFKIKAVIDFYGPSNLLLFYGNGTPTFTNTEGIEMLLGVSPLARPDISNAASPFTYVDAGDPPFFIVNGEKDPDVPPAQSYLLKSYLDLVKVKNDLTIVKDAPHYGVMFDADSVRLKLMDFLRAQMK